MTFAPKLAQILGAVGGGFTGLAMDRQQQAARAVQSAREAREAERDRALNAHTAALTHRIQNPLPEPVDYTPAKFSVGGKAMQGFTTKEGKFFDANRQPISGDVVPYEEPRSDGIPSGTVLPGADGKPPQLVVTRPGGGMSLGQTIAVPDVTKDPTAAGAADRVKRETALQNVQGALDALEKNLIVTGSTILPSAEKSELQTNYNNVLLQMKEAYNLGVLNGPDYMLMQKILSDPTSLQGRAEALGRDDEQKKRVLAQITQVRERMKGISATPSAGKTLSPTDAEKAKSDPGFAAWLRSQGYTVP